MVVVMVTFDHGSYPTLVQDAAGGGGWGGERPYGKPSAQFCSKKKEFKKQNQNTRQLTARVSLRF